MSRPMQTVAVLGASPKADRYSNKAVRLLREHGHRVIPVNPAQDLIEGLPAVHALPEIAEPVDTLTLYMSPQHLTPIAGDIVALRPGRVIFNPGTEDANLQRRLDEAGIPWEEACTLVMLRTGQF